MGLGSFSPSRRLCLGAFDKFGVFFLVGVMSLGSRLYGGAGLGLQGFRVVGF